MLQYCNAVKYHFDIKLIYSVCHFWILFYITEHADYCTFSTNKSCSMSKDHAYAFHDITLVQLHRVGSWSDNNLWLVRRDQFIQQDPSFEKVWPPNELNEIQRILIPEMHTKIRESQTKLPLVKTVTVTLHYFESSHDLI